VNGTHSGGLYRKDPLACRVRFPLETVDEPTTLSVVPGLELLSFASTPGPATEQRAPVGQVKTSFTATGAGGGAPVTETVSGTVKLLVPLL
jgi:hypothetical protein